MRVSHLPSVDAGEVFWVELFSRHHFLPQSVLNAGLPYREMNSVGAHILSRERECGPNKNLQPAK